MADHKLPSSIVQEIDNNYTALARKPSRFLSANFPIGVDDVQALLLDADTLEKCKSLYAKGISGISRSSNAAMRFRVADVPDGWRLISRDVLVHIQGIRVFFPKNTPYTMYVPDNDIERARTTDYSDALISNIDKDTWGRLAQWINAAVNAERRKQLAAWFGGKVLQDVRSTTMLHTLWPFLATLVKDHRWRHRITEVSKRTHVYVPPTDKLALVRKYRSAVEEILADAAITENVELVSSKTHAFVVGWEIKGNDWKPEK